MSGSVYVLLGLAVDPWHLPPIAQDLFSGPENNHWVNWVLTQWPSGRVLADTAYGLGIVRSGLILRAPK